MPYRELPPGLEIEMPAIEPETAAWNLEPSCSEMFDDVAVAVYATDRDGWLTYYNESAVALWGRRPVIGEERWCGSWRILEPDGTHLPHESCPMAAALREERPIRGVTALIERPDGTRVRYMPFPTPLFDRAGTLIGATNLLLLL